MNAMQSTNSLSEHEVIKNARGHGATEVMMGSPHARPALWSATNLESLNSWPHPCFCTATYFVRRHNSIYCGLNWGAEASGSRSTAAAGSPLIDWWAFCSGTYHDCGSQNETSKHQLSSALRRITAQRLLASSLHIGSSSLD